MLRQLVSTFIVLQGLGHTTQLATPKTADLISCSSFGPKPFRQRRNGLTQGQASISKECGCLAEASLAPGQTMCVTVTAFTSKIDRNVLPNNSL